MSTPPCAGFRYSSMQALDTMHNGTPLRSNANNVHTVQVCVQGAGTKALTNGRRLPKVKFAQCRGWQPHPVIIPSTKVRLSEGFRILLRLKSLKGLIGHSVMMSAIHFFAESTWLVLDTSTATTLPICIKHRGDQQASMQALPENRRRCVLHLPRAYPIAGDMCTDARLTLNV